MSETRITMSQLGIALKLATERLLERNTKLEAELKLATAVIDAARRTIANAESMSDECYDNLSLHHCDDLAAALRTYDGRSSG